MREHAPVDRQNQEAGFTQPRAHLLADPCIIFDMQANDAFLRRIEVPRSQSGMTLTVTAVWEKNAFTSPLWLYARKDYLPTASNYDKT